MATLEQLSAALVKADAAGNAADAKVFADAIRKMRTAPVAEVPEEKGGFLQGVGNLAAGALRGAGSIGATLLAPYDMTVDAIKGDRGKNLSSLITGKELPSRNQERRQAMDDGLQSMGAQPDSLMYKGGKLAGEIAGTAGAGGAVANTIMRVAPAAVTAAPRVAQALEALKSGGFSLGGSSSTGLAGKAADLGIRAAGGAVSGGVQAGLINPDDVGTGAVIGGAFPVAAKAIGAGAKAAGSALRGAPIAPEVLALADRAKQLGIDIPADRLVNSRPLNALASSLNYVPFSGRSATEDAMSSQLNKALSKTFGQDSSNVTQALRKASGDLGGQFDTVLQNNTVKITPAFKTALQAAEDQATNELGAEGASIIHKQIAQIQAKGLTGEIDGQTAYNIKKTLDRIGNRNSPESYYARDLKKALMNALNDSLGPQEAQSFATLRKQYGNMLNLENLAKNGAEGEVSVARLGNMKSINNSDMQELADIAAQFVKQRESQHGAMQRVVLGTGAGLAGLAGGGMIGGGLGLAGAAAAGRSANSLLNSNMLKQAVRSQPGSSGNALSKLLPYGARAAIPASLDR